MAQQENRKRKQTDKLESVLKKYCSVITKRLQEEITSLFKQKVSDFIGETDSQQNTNKTLEEALKLLKRETIFSSSRDEGCLVEDGETCKWLGDLYQTISSIRSLPVVLEDIYLIHVPVTVTFRYILDRVAASNEDFEKAELDPLFTEWGYKWKGCLFCPLNHVFSSFKEGHDDWKWLDQKGEKALQLLGEFKKQLDNKLDNKRMYDHCQEMAEEIAEDGIESIAKTDLDWGDWDSYVHYDGKETFNLTLCVAFTKE